MKKSIVIVLVILAILVIAATVFFNKLDGLIADAIRTEGTSTIGTTVNVASVQTDLALGTATINGLSIANPAGYQKPHAVSIDTFSADVDYESQVIEQILIAEPIINAEFTEANRSNFQDLLDNMPDTDDDENADSEDDFELTINSLKLTKATVNLVHQKLGEHTFVMDDFILNNLQGTASEISDEVTNKLIKHVSKQVSDYAKVAVAALIKEKATAEIKQKLNDKLSEKLKGKGLKGKLKDFKF